MRGSSVLDLANRVEAWDRVGRRRGSSAGLAYFAPVRLSGMLDSRTAAAALAGRHPAEGNTLRRSSAGSLGLPAFRREPADSLGVWLEAMGIVYLEVVCVPN